MLYLQQNNFLHVNTEKFQLLKDLCHVFAPSGNEIKMKDFILDYLQKNIGQWAYKPEILHGEEFQDCIILKFGKPRTAIFAHMDSIGFTVRYDNQLVSIGGPDVKDGYTLVGEDSLGAIECSLKLDEDHHTFYEFGRAIDRGTELTFKPDFRETKNYVQCCYMDNRLGVYNALQVAEGLKDGLIVFSCREEHGGGAVPFLCKYMYEILGVKQTLISDITWITDGVHHGEGAAISMRDSSLPRRQYLQKIMDIASQNKLKYQLEVEGIGGSDGREIQESPYPIDWCFIGAAEDNVHTPNEIVHKDDIDSMVTLYQTLMKEL